MSNKAKEFSQKFIDELGKFQKIQEQYALQDGLTKDEFLALTSTTYNILGRGWRKFTKRAGLK